MHINISKSETGNNKGSSGQLVAYLEKENRLLCEQNPKLEPEYWFNQESQRIQPYQVRYDIDHNVDRLSKDEAKFFLVNISPAKMSCYFSKRNLARMGLNRS